MFNFARSAVRAYPSSFVGSFIIILVASALLAANGVLMETGLRSDAPLLTTVAASFAGTAILVVVLVVASTFASALRQRHAQFALLRAIGATPTQVRAMVTAEVAIVFALAAPLGAIPGLFAGNLLLPLLSSSGVVPAGLVLTISALPVLGVLVLLFPTALLAARLAARQVTKVSPTAAVRGADAESAHLSRGRAISTVVFFAAGLMTASVPFFVSGTIGSATGATSAFLLVTAAALGGPAIVGAMARRAARATSSSRFAAAMLAAVNSRGFSRRLTAAIIPLALLLSLGTVQTGVNATVVEASGMQLRDGLGSALVVTAPEGVSPSQLAAVESTSGIDAVVGSSTVAAEVRGDEQGYDEFSWEQTGVRSLTGDSVGLIDVDVTSGSLDDLTSPATVAVSSDGFRSVGDSVQMRFGSKELIATVVAVYDRGLGFGEYIMLDSSLPASVRPVASDVLLVSGSADLTSLGLKTSSVDEYADAAVAGAATQQQLGAILLFVLIFFVAIAAANTLVMLTRARSAEFALLRRIGATRAQLSSMIAIESGFVMLMALVIGTLAVLPALVGVAYGLLGALTLGISWPVYAGLVVAVVVIAGVAMVGSARVGGIARV